MNDNKSTRKRGTLTLWEADKDRDHVCRLVELESVRHSAIDAVDDLDLSHTVHQQPDRGEVDQLVRQVKRAVVDHIPAKQNTDYFLLPFTNFHQQCLLIKSDLKLIKVTKKVKSRILRAVCRYTEASGMGANILGSAVFLHPSWQTDMTHR